MTYPFLGCGQRFAADAAPRDVSQSAGRADQFAPQAGQPRRPGQPALRQNLGRRQAGSATSNCLFHSRERSFLRPRLHGLRKVERGTFLLQ